MFLSVREYFRQRGGRMHAARLARLFAFEFAIVVLGVFVAQSLQASFQRSGRIEDGREVASSMRGAVQHYNAIAVVGLRAEECFADRLDELAAINLAGGRVDDGMLGIPRLGGVNEFRFSPSDYSAARLASGDQFVADARGAADRLDDNDTIVARLLDNWITVSLLERRHGPLDADDRRAIRDALIAVRADWGALLSYYRANEALTEKWDLAEENPFLDHHLPDLEACLGIAPEA